MPTNAQLQAEIDRLNQAMAERTRIKNACRINGIAIDDAYTRQPEIAGSAMEKPASRWFLHSASTTRVEEQTWGIFREYVLQHIEASNYQSVLREKLQRLKQTADIETYNGEYSALIFRVEGMSVLNQVLFYANGLKHAELREARESGDADERKVRHEKTKTFNEQAQDNKKTSKGKPFRGKGRFKPSSNSKSKETRTCHFCNKPGHIKANCFAWKKEQGKQGNEKSRL
ncbi:hypothetical protein F442_06410 [Phytophthora nicotianae P10297]|uniref:CCHC-type domain-containing protein n=1 Tax=Phytophthora nicotianae P10297 TaxID=1317064 RepID=W2ZK80_PHYNI|nr:hypothetical protein F442_06410 [Phytophthora nicotianae P10297]